MRILERLALVALVGVIAVVFLSSSLLAGVISLVTIGAVLIDMLALSRVHEPALARPDETPRSITVDLNRRS
jgi:uncharacterized membrane protein